MEEIGKNLGVQLESVKLIEIYYDDNLLPICPNMIGGILLYSEALSGGEAEAIPSGVQAREFVSLSEEQVIAKVGALFTANFRRYPNVEDSIADHSAYLFGAKNGNKLRYDGLKGCTDYKKAWVCYEPYLCR